MMKTKTIAHTALAAMLCAAMMSCDNDSGKESRVPVIDNITFDKTEAYPGDTIKATLNMKDPGEYVKVTYSCIGTPEGAIKGSTFDCGSSQNKANFDIVVAEEANALFDKIEDESIEVTVNVLPKRISAYAGDKPYLDPTLMESKTKTFTLFKK